MKKPVTKAKRKPRPPGTMEKAWETRRHNQAIRKHNEAVAAAQRSVGTPAMFEDGISKAYQSLPEAKRASAQMFRQTATANRARNNLSRSILEEAKQMPFNTVNEALYGDNAPPMRTADEAFKEQYTKVLNYIECLERLGFKVTFELPIPF